MLMHRKTSLIYRHDIMVGILDILDKGGKPNLSMVGVHVPLPLVDIDWSFISLNFVLFV